MKSERVRKAVQQGYPYEIYRFCELPSGRIRDLPEEERTPFTKRLYGQTVPIGPGKMDEQDYFYICDYLEWKAGAPVSD